MWFKTKMNNRGQSKSIKSVFVSGVNIMIVTLISFSKSAYSFFSAIAIKIKVVGEFELYNSGRTNRCYQTKFPNQDA